jgi:hypothetical protein
MFNFIQFIHVVIHLFKVITLIILIITIISYDLFTS